MGLITNLILRHDVTAEPESDVWVVLTPEGAREHRKYHKRKRSLIFGALGGFAFPAIIPSAGVGIAAGGNAIGVNEATQSAVGAVIGGLTSGMFFGKPEGGTLGKVLMIGITKFPVRLEYKVEWQISDHNEILRPHTSWHLVNHLKHLDSSEQGTKELMNNLNKEIKIWSQKLKNS
jgi:hypothetical protein